VDYPELFSLIGYSYGGVDEYFQIPDFKGRFPIGKSDTLPGATALADVGGNYEIALNFDHLPNHSHTVTDPGHSHRLYGGTDTDFEEELVDALSDNTIGGPAGVAGEQGGNKGYVSTNSANTKFVENSLSNITLQSTGQSEPFNILPPFLTINFIIYAGKNV
jgi:microcystin-dependent protein